MATLAEVKAAIEDQAKGTQTLRDEVKTLKDDAVSQDSFAKLEALVTELDEKRTKLENEYLAELEETKKLAEEASLKAGRRGGDGDSGPNEVDVEHKSAFIDYMRHRHDPSMVAAVTEAEKKAIGSATGTGGGVAIPSVMDGEIDRKTSDESVMRGLVHTITLGTSDYRKVVNKGGAGYAWAGAGDTRNATTPFDVYEAEPAMGTIYAYPEFQEEQLDDVFFDLEGELITEISDGFANGIDDAIIDGTGTKMPQGMLATAPVADADGVRADQVFQYLASGTADTIGTADTLMELVYLLKRRYRRRASWIMNDMTTVKVRTMKDGNGQFLWAQGLQVGQPDRLLGYPVHAVDAMPDIAANSTPIGFGEWNRAYTFVERHGTRITKDEITKPGFVKWHIRRRAGGMVTNDDSAKFVKAAAA